MKELSGHIILSVFATLLCAFGLSACTEDGNPDDRDTQEASKTLLVLHLSPVNAANSQTNGKVTEKIKSLRIIMLNKTDSETIIECNELISFDEPYTASSFNHEFTRNTIPGKKKFYFIANEESIEGNIAFKQSADLPNNLPKTLKELLESYTSDKQANEFEKVINAVYFSPKYTINESEIFLPYTSFYEGTEVIKDEDGWHNLTQPDMYLVPVATKFLFNFYNYRSNPVKINEITLSPIDTHNFLMANIAKESTDYTKSFDGESLYWIDWLAKVAAASQTSSNANNKYGWIFDYGIPTESTLKSEQLINSTIDNYSVGAVKTGDTEDTPGELLLGPYYFPESKSSEVQDARQVYRLTLNVNDESAKTGPEFEQIPIENLKSLFRNTCVIINITMREGNVDVYAEIADWNRKSANGWVIEGQKP